MGLLATNYRESLYLIFLLCVQLTPVVSLNFNWFIVLFESCCPLERELTPAVIPAILLLSGFSISLCGRCDKDEYSVQLSVVRIYKYGRFTMTTMTFYQLSFTANTEITVGHSVSFDRERLPRVIGWGFLKNCTSSCLCSDALFMPLPLPTSSLTLVDAQVLHWHYAITDFCFASIFLLISTFFERVIIPFFWNMMLLSEGCHSNVVTSF